MISNPGYVGSLKARRKYLSSESSRIRDYTKKTTGTYLASSRLRLFAHPLSS